LTARFDAISAQVAEGTTLVQSSIVRRDIVETFAALVVIVSFAAIATRAANWVMWFGCVVIVAVAILIPIVLWLARRRPVTVISAASFRDFVDSEIIFLRRQAKLLRTVAWWYIGPIYLGVGLIILGVFGPRDSMFELIFAAAFLVGMTALSIYGWWINQSARKKNLEPLLAYYQGLRDALESGDESPLSPPVIPLDFYGQTPYKPISKRQQRIWLIMIAVSTALVACGGYAIMWSFDARTGNFVVGTAPVVAFLLYFISGLWRSKARTSDFPG
jgi:hypothetical protein